MDDKLLQHLDWLETHPDTYTRTPTQCVLLDSQQPLDCEVYLVKDFNPRLLALPHFSSYEDGVHQGLQYISREDRDDGSFSLRREIKQQKED